MNEMGYIRPYDSDEWQAMIHIAEELPEWFTPKGVGKMKVDLRFQNGFVAVKTGGWRGKVMKGGVGIDERDGDGDVHDGDGDEDGEETEGIRREGGSERGDCIGEAEEIVGFLSYYVTEGDAHIGWIGVRPDLHRQGIGSMMINRLRLEVAGKGVGRMVVSTLGESVAYEPYAWTRAFYRSMGFRDYESISRDDPECPESLIMIMELDESEHSNI